MKTRNQGFSLFELMIVLVAIGLTAGGVLAGKSLMKSAALKSLNSEMQSLKVAINQFRTEYNAIPGDFPKATDVWGSADGDGTTTACYNMDKSANIATCNGDGDGRLPSGVGGPELFLIWQHLSNAGMIDNKYTGAPGVSATSAPPHTLDCDVGLNCPASKFAPGTGFGVRFVGVSSGDTSAGWFDGSYGHIIMFGKEKTTEDNLPRNPALTAEEMSKLDSKFDDGLPAQGNIVARTGDMADFDDCTQLSLSDVSNTSAANVDAVYALSGATDADDSQTKQACQVILRNILE